MKNCCLYNYFDTKQNEIIPYFTASFTKSYDELSSNDFKQMVKNFEQLKFFNNDKKINVMNPEFVLNYHI